MSIRPWKRGTAAQRATNSVVPLGGEIGVETDTGRIVVSDGVTPWSGLSPAVRVTELNAFSATVSSTYALITNVLTFVDNGDGTFDLSGPGITDNDDGTFTMGAVA